jgi:PTH1 family peptidyl-tRNA hydrolase
MKVIVGLGNPGREYATTRHNLGFMVVDELLRRAGGGLFRKRFKADLVDIMHEAEKLVLVKPQTYMNLSGHSVRETAGWYKVPRQDILIVLDDLDLPFGSIRMRADGSAGGHNGLKSVTEQLGGRDIPRLRSGSGAAPVPPPPKSCRGSGRRRSERYPRSSAVQPTAASGGWRRASSPQ